MDICSQEKLHGHATHMLCVMLRQKGRATREALSDLEELFRTWEIDGMSESNDMPGVTFSHQLFLLAEQLYHILSQVSPKEAEDFKTRLLSYL